MTKLTLSSAPESHRHHVFLANKAVGIHDPIADEKTCWSPVSGDLPLPDLEPVRSELHRRSRSASWKDGYGSGSQCDAAPHGPNLGGRMCGSRRRPSQHGGS